MNRQFPYALAALAAAAALSLSGCGGGGGNPDAPSLATVASVNAASKAPTAPPSGGFNNLVVFGDSLSDDGAYTLAAYATYMQPLTGLPYPYGGQFTVNGAATGNWTGQLAQSLGLSLTPNVIGYATGGTASYLTPTGVTTSQSQATCAFNSAPSGSPANCTDFAQGGSMVANATGIGNSQGALTFPVTQQLQNYLAQFGSFHSTQLVTVLAGSNDVFTALSNVQTAEQQGVSQALAVSQAQASVGAAADQLAASVQTMLQSGAQYVLVYTLPDSSLTPFGQSLSGGTTCDNTNPTTACYLLSNLVQVFNQRLLNDLQGQSVKMIDGFALLKQEITQPAQFGFTNVTTPWCNLSAVPSSLLCNVNTPATAYGASTSNLGSWLFADSVHPTPAGYQVIADQTLQAMRGFGWAL